MCQIIALKTTRKKFKKIIKDIDLIKKLESMLNKKGGDYTNVSYIMGIKNNRMQSNSSLMYLFERIYEDIKHERNRDSLQILLFSRQQPEMELNGETVQEQPYSLENDEGSIFAVHGTIHNDRELAEELGVEIFADTEILQFIKPNNWEKAEGAFAVIGIDDTDDIYTFENGLKIWKNYLVDDGKHLADVVSTSSLDFLDPFVDNYNHVSVDKRALFVSFSGGMDISLSLYHELDKNMHNRVLLNYFAWGSRAEDDEMDNLNNMLAFYIKEFPTVEFDLDIVQAEIYFDEYFEMNQAPLPKISLQYDGELGDEKETEAPLAYVPYRNTQFAILMASKAEAFDLKNVDFMFGLNLSEGMVFMDNSEGWLESISELIKYGGKDYKISGTYNVIAPYFPRTKTNMLQEFAKEHSVTTLEQLLNLSKSCYYPEDDGTPCGKCGSCILRNKSIAKLDIAKLDLAKLEI